MRIKNLYNTATEADLTSGNYFGLDGSAGSLKVPANIIQYKITISEHQGFLTSTGSYGGGSTYHCYVTNKIPVTASDVIKYRGVGRSASVSALFYDSANAVLSSVQYNTPNDFVDIVVPSGAVRVILSSFTEAAKEIDFDFILPESSLALVYKDFEKVYDKFYSLGLCTYTENRGWLKSDGGNADNINFHNYTTEFIPVSQNDVFKYKGVGRSSAMSYVFFDSSKSVVSYGQYNSSTEFVDITIPSGVSYAKFSSFSEAATTIPFELLKNGTLLCQNIAKEPPVVADILTHKKWYACGDSFTHGDFTSIATPSIARGKYVGQLPVYPYLIGNRTLCDVQNIAVSGATLAQPSDGTFTNVFTRTSTGLLYTTDFSDADYITLYFGINDSHKNTPIGTIDDADNSTFYGAWNVALDYLTSNYPAAHIGIIVSNGCDTADYPTATKAIAEKWGVRYLDLDGGVGCPTMLRCSSRNPASDAIKARRLDQQKVSATNTHPNVLAHSIESAFIEAWLKTL